MPAVRSPLRVNKAGSGWEEQISPNGESPGEAIPEVIGLLEDHGGHSLDLPQDAHRMFLPRASSS